MASVWRSGCEEVSTPVSAITAATSLETARTESCSPVRERAGEGQALAGSLVEFIGDAIVVADRSLRRGAGQLSSLVQ